MNFSVNTLVVECPLTNVATLVVSAVLVATAYHQEHNQRGWPWWPRWAEISGFTAPNYPPVGCSYGQLIPG